LFQSPSNFLKTFLSSFVGLTPLPDAMETFSQLENLLLCRRDNIFLQHQSSEAEHGRDKGTSKDIFVLGKSASNYDHE
jgi:hypothetical protein